MSERKSPEDLMQSLNPPKKVGVFAWLRGRFFAGMVIAAPLAITFCILQDNYSLRIKVKEPMIVV